MKWEELTGDIFITAVKKVKGVCLLPLSCIERHGHHLPMGTDMFIGRELCVRAAAIEPAIIFPDYIFTQILGARHMPGTIGIEPELIIPLLQNTCQEISRNGLHKIILVNAHGGNDNLIRYFAQIQLASPRDYVVYVTQPPFSSESKPVSIKWETTVDGHAGELETSVIQAIKPELVKKEALPSDGEGMPLNRLNELRDTGTFLGIWWYADFPTHYCGDGIPATSEKGQRWLEIQSQALAKVIRKVKDDKVSRALQDEFFKKAKQH
jgi:creatinine amidohydrolase